MSQSLSNALTELQAAYQQRPNPSYHYRLNQLKRLEEMLRTKHQLLIDAIDEDYQGRSHHETMLYEVIPALTECRFAKANLKQWLKPKKTATSWLLQSAKTQIVAKPKGVVGIMVPWNYPIFLALGPLIGALAAGNKVMLKLSESAPKTAAVLKSLLESALGPESIRVFTGDAAESIAFSKLPFNHLLFTGSTMVGKAVYQQASQNLVPVTLELGGKSPTIIDGSANLTKAINRTLHAKFINGGQTCIAPDSLFLHQSYLTSFISQARQCFQQTFPQGITPESYSAIINQQQLDRLLSLLQDAQQKGAKILPLSQTEPAKLEDITTHQKYLVPMLVLDVTDNMLISQQEIFGPILPVYTFDNIAEVITALKDKPTPLALYYFGQEKQAQQQVLEQLPAGGITINGAIYHIADPTLPFGGLGSSGIGAYHGKAGFDAFSHLQAQFYQGKLSALDFVGAPFKGFSRLISRLILNIDIYRLQHILKAASVIALLSALALLLMTLNL